MTDCIDIAKDFSEYPAGRFFSDGQYSGEAFRQNVLLKHLKNAAKIRVDLDGAAGYGSSFLEEAFGGLVRLGLFSSKELHNKLEINANDTSLIEEIWEYIDTADSQQPLK